MLCSVVCGSACGVCGVVCGVCVVVCGCVGMEGGRRRCITEKAVDIPERVIVFCSLKFQTLFHNVNM